MDQTPLTSLTLLPLPVANKKIARKPRKILLSFIFSESPVKKALEQKKKGKKQRTEIAKQKWLRMQTKRKKETWLQLDFSPSYETEPSYPASYTDTDDDVDLEDEDKG